VASGSEQLTSDFSEFSHWTAIAQPAWWGRMEKLG
jgi:hypothetical protein